MGTFTAIVKFALAAATDKLPKTAEEYSFVVISNQLRKKTFGIEC
jgi:hypothetical protein